MVDSSLSCVSSGKNQAASTIFAVDYTPAYIFTRGDGIVPYFRTLTKIQERQKVYLLILNLFR